MTHNDLQTALQSALEPVKRHGKGGVNVGGLVFNKRDGNPHGVIASTLLSDNGGTLAWDMDDPINGRGTFDNIHQFAAAEYYAPGGTLRQRIEASQDYAEELRSGFNTLSKFLLDNYGIPLYRCALPGENLIRVITIYPDYVVSETAGLTAADVQKYRDRKALMGQAQATRRRLEATTDGNDRREILDEVIRVLTSEVDAPKRKRIGAVPGNSQS